MATRLTTYYHQADTTKARPSNTAVRGLMGNGAYTEVALSFLRGAGVGEAGAGALDAVQCKSYGLYWIVQGFLML